MLDGFSSNLLTPGKRLFPGVRSFIDHLTSHEPNSRRTKAPFVTLCLQSAKLMRFEGLPEGVSAAKERDSR
jgi:hypothetical protein